MLKQVLVTLILGASLIAGGTLLPTTVQAEAKVGKKVGEPLAAALDAGKKGQYPVALAKLKQADSVPGKTAFEQFQINETYGFVYLKQRNFAQAAGAYERNLASGQLPGSQVNDRVKQLAQLYFQSPRNLAKVIEYSNRYLNGSGAKDPAMYAMLGQAYQLNGNDKMAVTSVQTAIRNAQASGQRPEENWLRILLKSFGALNDAENLSKTTLALVQTYPSKDNWRLLSSELRKQASGDDKIAMNVYRLMTELDLMDKPENFTDSAITAIQSNLPAEAVKIMDRGYASRILSPEEPRAQRILADARKRQAAQQQGLPGLQPGGDEVAYGNILLSYGQAAPALAAGKRAVQKGAANVDDAYMLIGRSQLALKNSAEARKAFGQVKGAGAAPVAKLWGIYASRS